MRLNTLQHTKVCHMAYLMLCMSIFIFNISSNGQLIELETITPPKPGSLSHYGGAFFLYGSEHTFTFPPEAIGKSAEITFKEIRVDEASTDMVKRDVGWQSHNTNGSPNNSTPATNNTIDVNSMEFDRTALNKSPVYMDAVLIPYQKFTQFIGRSYVKTGGKPFCCRAMAVGSNIPFEPTEDCPYPGAFRRSVLEVSGEPSGHVYAKPIPLSNTPESAETATFMIKDSGIYLFAIANCGGFSNLKLSGEVSIRNSFGYLPGYEYPNFIYFLASMIIYISIILIWGSFMYCQRQNLIKFHYLLLGIASLGLFECIFKLSNLYYWNEHPTKSYYLFMIGVVFTVLKHICSYILVLLGALGWSITIPSLDKSTVRKLQIIIFFYVILDTTRQISDEYNNTRGTFSVWRFLLILLPISALNVTVFYWIYVSLQHNIALLSREKQHEKLLIYRRFFCVLLLALILAKLLLITQIYIASWAPSERWELQGLLTEGFPHTLFLILLVAMMIIWKPHAHSSKLAYFTEIGDGDDGDVGDIQLSKVRRNNDIEVWGQELGFQDHFGEADMSTIGGESPIVPSFHSVAIDNPGIEEEEKYLENAQNVVVIGKPTDDPKQHAPE